MFSLDKFLILSADQKNIYVRSDDGKQTYTILVFSINLAFVNNNLLKIKQVGTDQIITIPFRNIVEANQALKKLQDQIDVLRDNTPFILERGMQNYVDDKITNVNLDLSGIYATLSVFDDNFDNIFATLSVVDSNFDNIFATLSVFDDNFDNVTSSTFGTWQYSSDGGSNWNAWDDTQDQVGNYIRYTATSLPSGVRVRALLTQQ